MRRTSILMRQIFSAAFLLLLPIGATAETNARYDPVNGALIISGISSENIALLAEDPSLIRLQNAATPEAASMLFSLSHGNGDLHVLPRFALQPGAAYAASIYWRDTQPFHTEFTLDPATASAPILAAFSPSQSVIPANTLRFYLTFSEPMARGQMRDKIHLLRENGQKVRNPFLNLETELWDVTQKHLTLILDPGRIKQGVGPNALAGAPLVDGARYRLVVSGAMTSAQGGVMGTDRVVNLHIGPAERREINPHAWTVALPLKGTTTPFTVAFDRIMDVAATRRLMRLEGPDAHNIDGTLVTDGGGWSLFPHTPWQDGKYRLFIDPRLEDVAGNTLRAPFDAPAGTIGMSATEASIPIQILRN